MKIQCFKLLILKIRKKNHKDMPAVSLDCLELRYNFKHLDNSLHPRTHRGIYNFILLSYIYIAI